MSVQMTNSINTVFRHLPRKRRNALPIRKWFSLGRQRSRLLELDDHMLRDIGASREMAQREGERPFWDVPPNWLK